MDGKKQISRDALVELGRVGAASGIKGEVKIDLYSWDTRNFKKGSTVLVKKAGEYIPLEIENVRMQKGRPIAKFAGVSDRNAAESLTGAAIFMEEDLLEELSEGEFYVKDLVGLAVFDRTSGKEIGKVAEIISNPAQSIYRIEAADGKEVLVPAVDEFIKNVDIDAGRVEVELIPGFMD